MAVYAPLPMLVYPHMGPVETNIWTGFLKEHGKYFQKFEYDIHLGKGLELDPTEPEWLRRQTRYLTTRRVDAVGYTDQEVWLFEVKPYIGASTIGQLVLYRDLWQKEKRDTRKIYMAAVGRHIGYDLDVTLEKYDIRVFLIPRED